MGVANSSITITDITDGYYQISCDVEALYPGATSGTYIKLGGASCTSLTFNALLVSDTATEVKGYWAYKIDNKNIRYFAKDNPKSNVTILLSNNNKPSLSVEVRFYLDSDTTNLVDNIVIPVISKDFAITLSNTSSTVHYNDDANIVSTMVSLSNSAGTIITPFTLSNSDPADGTTGYTVVYTCTGLSATNDNNKTLNVSKGTGYTPGKITFKLYSGTTEVTNVQVSEFVLNVARHLISIRYSMAYNSADDANTADCNDLSAPTDKGKWYRLKRTFSDNTEEYETRYIANDGTTQNITSTNLQFNYYFLTNTAIGNPASKTTTKLCAATRPNINSTSSYNVSESLLTKSAFDTNANYFDTTFER